MSDQMIAVRLPDGSEKNLPAGASGADLAAAIGPGLARAAVAVTVGGELRDLNRPLADGDDVSIVTRSDDSEEALYALRHSAAHVLATAVRELYPDAGIGFGPPIENGFYYDFDVPKPFTPEDLEAIERKMAEVAKSGYGFDRSELSRDEAEHLFADDPLKLERLAEIPEGETISAYTDGPFTDLCRGPHVPSTAEIKHFKLLSGAGAYWRGDENRQMLQRIYGTAFYDAKSLEEHLHRLEEAKKRDHRKIGQALDLFSFQEEFGPGLVAWHPKGARIQMRLRRWIEDLLTERGYEFVYTPHVTSEALFERSGHLPTYAENMYPAMEGEGESFRVKPMNCPGHTMIYAARPRSYRDLPLRLSEIANACRRSRTSTVTKGPEPFTDCSGSGC
ncbi:MAG: TGS domain-containing protein [Gemmatimonadota bacterium]